MLHLVEVVTVLSRLQNISFCMRIICAFKWKYAAVQCSWFILFLLQLTSWTKTRTHTPTHTYTHTRFMVSPNGKMYEINLNTSASTLSQEVYAAWKHLLSYLSANLTCHFAHTAVLLPRWDAFTHIYSSSLSATQHKGELGGLITY